MLLINSGAARAIAFCSIVGCRSSMYVPIVKLSARILVLAELQTSSKTQSAERVSCNLARCLGKHKNLERERERERPIDR